MSLSLLMSIFLGLVQGLAEFLPISSSGHLSIIQNLFHLSYDENEHLLFDVLLHLGTLVSVIVFYRKELRSMVTDAAAAITGKGDSRDEEGRLKPTLRNILLIVAGTLPLLLIVPFRHKIELLFYNTPFISFALIITGVLLFVSGKLSEGRKNEKTATIADALVVGLSQAIATVPGLSRSGTTITVGLSRGFRREYAVQYSFLLSIPAVLGSIILTLVSAIKAGIKWANVPAYLVGMLVAGVSGYYALKLVKKLITTDRFSKLAYYCWGVGILSLILSAIL